MDPMCKCMKKCEANELVAKLLMAAREGTAREGTSGDTIEQVMRATVVEYGLIAAEWLAKHDLIQIEMVEEELSHLLKGER